MNNALFSLMQQVKQNREKQWSQAVDSPRDMNAPGGVFATHLPDLVSQDPNMDAFLAIAAQEGGIKAGHPKQEAPGPDSGGPGTVMDAPMPPHWNTAGNDVYGNPMRPALKTLKKTAR